MLALPTAPLKLLIYSNFLSLSSLVEAQELTGVILDSSHLTPALLAHTSIFTAPFRNLPTSSYMVVSLSPSRYKIFSQAHTIS
jgi:hypothetical protein